MGLRIIALLLLTFTTSCAAIERRQACQEQIGPRPFEAAEVFGPVGFVLASATPERQAWYRAVNGCVARMKAMAASG